MSNHPNPVNPTISFQEPKVINAEESLGTAYQLNARSINDSQISKKRIIRINVEVPPTLAESFGYQGNSKWVHIFWAADLNKPVCSDGKIFCTSSKLTWELFLENVINIEAFDTLCKDHSFLLDRLDRILYLGNTATISALIDDGKSLGLLSPVKPAAPVFQFRNLTAIFVLGTICGATLAGLLLSIGLGLISAFK